MSGTDEQQQGQDAPSGPPGAGADELEEINEERRRRLAPENRPENTEVDNTGDNAPDLSRVDPAAGEDASSGGGADDTGGAREESGPPGASESEIDEINEERRRRLAPENRPENTEVDNTGDNAPDLSRVDPEASGG